MAISEDTLEDIITSAQHVPSEKTVQALREQLNQDTQILASLNPQSGAHQRLSARIEAQTNNLIDYEDQRERQRVAVMHAMIEERRRSDEATGRSIGFVLLAIGGGVTYFGWGTWWLVLGLLLVLFGLSGLFGKNT